MNSEHAHSAFQSPIDGSGTKRFARRMSGFTLVELIIFIVVSGILAVGLAGVFSSSIRGGAEPGRLTQATQIAQERMELILAQKRRARLVGSFVFADPCPASPVCTPVPAGYAVVSNIAPDWNGDINYRLITVTVNGPANATLISVVANF